MTTKSGSTSALSRTHGRVIAVCSSEKKGTPKADVTEGVLEVGFGLKGDAHGGDWHRQVSLLAIEQIETMKGKGFDLGSISVGARLKIGETAIVEVTQIGKECHTRCAIYNKIGECIMPEQGVFAKVIEGGAVKTGDDLELVE